MTANFQARTPAYQQNNNRPATDGSRTFNGSSFHFRISQKEEQVRQLRQRISADDARSFAQQLVSDKKLTRFQATVLLEGREIPLVLDRYVVLSEIGKGGMGAVYKALHQQMDRVVALKILPKEAVDSEEKVRRFHREVKTAAKLEHPNIATSHDANEDKGLHFLVMSLVSGSDLSKIVLQQGPLPISKAVDCIVQAARGLEYAHQLGIVHRDIKPANHLKSVDALRMSLLQDTDEATRVISQAESLVGLSLNRSGLTGQGLGQLSTLTQLEKLFLNNCEKIDDEALSALPIFPQLRFLSLAWNTFSDAGLVRLKAQVRLSFLVLEQNRNLTGSGLQHLVELPSLRQLILTGAPPHRRSRSATSQADAAASHS